MQEAGLEEVRDYVTKRQNMGLQEVETYIYRHQDTAAQ